MKLEPNMYVRTKITDNCNCVYIRKIDEIDERPVFQNQICIDEDVIDGWGDDRILIDEEDISKASHNIIDLIEEKDLLEIEYFSLRYEKRVTRLFEVTYKEGRFINLDNAKCQFMLIDNDWTDNDKELEPIIKSIVTKESMESVTYYVKWNI